MPLFAVHALHHRVRCDGCGSVSALHCSEGVAQARAQARVHYEALGWKHVVPKEEPEHLAAWLEQHAGGQWLCPHCEVG